MANGAINTSNSRRIGSGDRDKATISSAAVVISPIKLMEICLQATLYLIKFICKSELSFVAQKRNGRAVKTKPEK